MSAPCAPQCYGTILVLTGHACMHLSQACATWQAWPVYFAHSMICNNNSNLQVFQPMLGTYQACPNLVLSANIHQHYGH